MSKKLKKIADLIAEKGLVQAIKTWIADKWFGGNEQLMMGTFYSIVVVGGVVLMYVMTNPSDKLISAVENVFKTIGWW